MHPSRLEPNFVICSYPLPNSHSTQTQVFCQPDKSDLDATLAARGMGETYSMDGHHGRHRVPKMPSEHYYEGRLGDAMHAAIWVGMILNHCNPVAGREAMLDTGVIHELSHEIEVDYDQLSYGHRRHQHAHQWKGGTQLKMLERIRAFERLVPGLHPRFGLHPTKQHLWDEYETEMVETVLDRQRAVHEGAMIWPRGGLAAYGAAMGGTVTGRMGGTVTGRMVSPALRYPSPLFAEFKSKRKADEPSIMAGDLAALGASIYAQMTPEQKTKLMKSLGLAGEEFKTLAEATAGTTKSMSGLQKLLYGDPDQKPRAFDGLKPMRKMGGIIVIDEASFMSSNHDWFADRLIMPDKDPLPNQRQFEMSRVSQGQTAKEKRVAACVAKLKKTKGVETTAHKSQGLTLGEISGEMHTTNLKDMLALFAGSGATVEASNKADASEAAFVAAMGGGVGTFYSAFDPAKPGADKTATMRFVREEVFGFAPTRPAPIIRAEFKVEDKVTPELDRMIESFKAVEAMHVRTHAAALMEQAMLGTGKATMTVNGRTYPISDVKVNYGGSA